jgi:UDP-N-acetylglucosamine--N-acetylmuramyl-(pentapeptide) pyrophosphoryl-undecaprenol N-acetylglucosamine transferase
VAKKNTYRIIIAGGGTGGHVFPAIAIANSLKDIHGESVQILFVGARGKLEMNKVPEAGFEIIGLPVSGFQRSLSVRNLAFPFKLGFSLLRSYGIISRFKPDVAVGVGGYASGPLLYAAAMRGIPTLIQEQNSYPGITNKILAKRASRICVAYDGMERFFEAGKIVKTGNPVRKEIRESGMTKGKAKALLDLDPGKPLILAIGGSLGARTINESLFGGLDNIHSQDVQLMWQCGKLYHDEFARKVNQAVHPNVRLTAFIRRMDAAYAAADIIISRAGALSISELCLIGKPVILVPSPNVAEDHQAKNAMALVESNAAIMVADADARSVLVSEALDLLSNKEKMSELGSNIKAMGLPDATEVIAGEVIRLIEER